ncbi:MAG: nuclear transport factor 2 family protein [Solirubrobacterales bacterium]
MSQENVALFRKAIDCYNRRDLESMLQMWHPEAEWYPFTAQVEGDDAYHGHEGLRRWWANVDATFEEIEASVEEVRDLGDTVLALGRLRARFRSGVALDSEIGWLTRLPRRSWRLGSGIPKPWRNPRSRWAAGVVQAPHRVHKGNCRDTRHGWAQQPKERCPPRPPFHRQTAEGLAGDDARAFVDGDKR